MPLTETGREQARQVGERLRGADVDVIYSSPLGRAADTAQAIAEMTGAPLRIDQRLSGGSRAGHRLPRVMPGGCTSSRTRRAHGEVSARRVWPAAHRRSAYICSQRMLICMRTTLQLNDELVVQAKISAAHTGRTLSQVIEDALRQALASRAEPPRRRTSVPTSPGRPMPGVNLDDNAGLLDLMDGNR